jgi:hypothetical protein
LPGSPFDVAKRSAAWVKIKLYLEQEFVIGGYTDPEGSRKFFGTLPIGFYVGKKFKFSGRVPIKRVADKIKGVILSEPGSALARQEGETAFGLDGRKSFLSEKNRGTF